MLTEPPEPITDHLKSKHRQRHREEFKCDVPECKKEGFRNSTELDRHRKSFHPSISGSRYRCNIGNCNPKAKSWSQGDTFRRHLKHAHGKVLSPDDDPSEFVYPIPQSRPAASDAITEPMDQGSSVQPDPHTSGPYRCTLEQCKHKQSTIFTDTEAFRQHLWLEHDIYPGDGDLTEFVDTPVSPPGTTSSGTITISKRQDELIGPPFRELNAPAWAQYDISVKAIVPQLKALKKKLDELFGKGGYTLTNVCLPHPAHLFLSGAARLTSSSPLARDKVHRQPPSCTDHGKVDNKASFKGRS